MTPRDQLLERMQLRCVELLAQLPPGDSPQIKRSPEGNIGAFFLVMHQSGTVHEFPIPGAYFSSSESKDNLAVKLCVSILAGKCPAVALMSPVWCARPDRYMLPGELEDLNNMEPDDAYAFVEKVRRERMPNILSDDPLAVELLNIWSVDKDDAQNVSATILRYPDRPPTVRRWDVMNCRVETDRFLTKLQFAIRKAETL